MALTDTAVRQARPAGKDYTLRDSDVPSTLLYDSPYRGDYPVCGDIWLNEAGSGI